MDAILFWARFEGRWLRGSEFHYPGAAERFTDNESTQELAEVRSAKREGVSQVDSVPEGFKVIRVPNGSNFYCTFCDRPVEP
jgi:hypothetical protein